MAQHEHWDIIVKPKSSFFKLNLREILAYKDLVLLMVKRDISAAYKQTILGPLWMLLQPVFTTAIYTFTFSYSAKLSTDGMPAILFYLVGQTFWFYFSDSLTKTSNTFISNSAVFGKVYFPRLVMPISVIISQLVKLGIQGGLLVAVYCYFCIADTSVRLQPAYLILLPFLVGFLGIFALSIGILFSSLTTKYRDFTFLLAFAVQLLMFASCVVFPVSMYSHRMQQLFMLNPVVTYLETIKFVLTGHGLFSVKYVVADSLAVLALLVFSMIVFNRTEKTFMDTV